MLIDIPQDYLKQGQYTETDLRTDIAVMLYHRRVLTLAKAASWLDISRLQFQKALAERGVTLNFSIEDMQTDLRTIESL